ncbi:MAG: amidohydrolase family protein, partial [bacterium]
MHPESVMLCCDDIHPDDRVVGHINSIVARAFENGHNIYDVLRAACVHPVEHYGLPVGLLRVGEPADFIVVDDLQRMNVVETWIDGARVACNGVASWPHMNATAINNFNVN